MTVKDLIEQLQAHDPGRLVVMSIDPEGNGYMPVDELWSCAYAHGEAHHEELTGALRKRGYTDEDIKPGTSALCFFPGND